MFAINKLRIKFTKRADAKYISHLDLNRYMQRLFKRGKIPVVMTQGFNLHPVMSFALPLSLGVESVCEYLDIKVHEGTNLDEVKKAIIDLSTDNIELLDVAEPIHHYNDIGYATYNVSILLDDQKAEVLNNYLSNSPVIEIEKRDKKTKKYKTKDVTNNVEISNISINNNMFNADFKLTAGTVDNVNVNSVISSILQKCDITPKKINILRATVLCKDNTEFE